MQWSKRSTCLLSLTAIGRRAATGKKSQCNKMLLLVVTLERVAPGGNQRQMTTERWKWSCLSKGKDWTKHYEMRQQQLLVQQEKQEMLQQWLQCTIVCCLLLPRLSTSCSRRKDWAWMTAVTCGKKFHLIYAKMQLPSHSEKPPNPLTSHFPDQMCWLWAIDWTWQCLKSWHEWNKTVHLMRLQSTKEREALVNPHTSERTVWLQASSFREPMLTHERKTLKRRKRRWPSKAQNIACKGKRNAGWNAWQSEGRWTSNSSAACGCVQAWNAGRPNDSSAPGSELDKGNHCFQNGQTRGVHCC